MAITLNLPSVLAAHTGPRPRTIEATGRTLGEAVADVAARYPASRPASGTRKESPIPSSLLFERRRRALSAAGGPSRPPSGRRRADRHPAIAGG